MRSSPLSFPRCHDGASSGRRWLRARCEEWRDELRFLARQMRLLSLLARHPALPWHARLVAAGTLGYLVSPVQVIPTFIPFIGQLDDLAVLFAGTRLLRLLAPAAVLAECAARLDAQPGTVG